MRGLLDWLGLSLWLALFFLVVCFMASILLVPMLHEWLKSVQPKKLNKPKRWTESSPNTWTEL